jgi:hypothetical protein
VCIFKYLEYIEVIEIKKICFECIFNICKLWFHQLNNMDIVRGTR